jgi:hypothetical protein
VTSDLTELSEVRHDTMASNLERTGY